VWTLEAGENLLAGDGVIAAVVASVAVDVGLNSGDEFVLVFAGEHLVAVFAGEAEGHRVSLGWDEGEAALSAVYASRWLISANPRVRARAA